MLKDQEKPEEIASYSDEDAYVLLPAGVSFSALKKNITVKDASQGSGTVTYTYEGQNVGSADVVLASDYVTSVTGKTDPDTAAQSEKEDQGFPLWAKILIGCAAGVVVVFAALTGFLLYRRQKRRRMRRRRKQRRRSQTRSRSHQRCR